MASFETDLARYLDAYDRAEHLASVEEDMMSENSDYAVNGEAATLIPSDLVADAEIPGPVRRYGSDDPGRLVPGVNGEGLY